VVLRCARAKAKLGAAVAAARYLLTAVSHCIQTIRIGTLHE
jgi:hypothetical protein